MIHFEYRRDPEANLANPENRSRDDELARLKQASLRRQAQQMAAQLGALVRRVEHEAPDMQARLRGAVEALQLLNLRLAASDMMSEAVVRQ